MPNITKSSDPAYRRNIEELEAEIESTEPYKQYYQHKFGTDTVLTDDQIYLMVGNSDDDDSPYGWADAMRQLEQELTEPAQQAAE